MPVCTRRKARDDQGNPTKDNPMLSSKTVHLGRASCVSFHPSADPDQMLPAVGDTTQSSGIQARALLTSDELKSLLCMLDELEYQHASWVRAVRTELLKFSPKPTEGPLSKEMLDSALNKTFRPSKKRLQMVNLRPARRVPLHQKMNIYYLFLVLCCSVAISICYQTEAWRGMWLIEGDNVKAFDIPLILEHWLAKSTRGNTPG